MKGFVGVTDNDWFAFLSQQPEIDEVNFWQPSGRIRAGKINQIFLLISSNCVFSFELIFNPAV